jgi:glycosyltransferase involved in cell wall biosynthesis
MSNSNPDSYPLISIIIPTFNHAVFLSDAIDSLLTQTYKNIEIIVVDDGSTDNTLEVVQQYQNSLILYLKQKNYGLPAARNFGLRKSKGKYVAFLDADDRFLPNHLQISHDTIREKPQVGFVCGNIRTFGMVDDFKHIHNCSPTPDHYASLLRGCFIVNVGACLFHKSKLIELGGFNEKYKASEDWELFFRIVRISPIYCHHQVVLEYRRTPGQMSRQLGRMLESSAKTLQKQWKYVKNNEHYISAYKEGVDDIIKYYGNPAADELVSKFKKGDLLTAWSLFIKLLRWYPKGLWRISRYSKS